MYFFFFKDKKKKIINKHQGYNLGVKTVNPRADDNSSTKKGKKMLSANRLSAIDVGVIISRLALN